MKQCPVCEKTFDDSLRFCQADGTPLVDKAEPVDPYKTMVASKEDIAAAIPKASAEAKPAVPEPSVPAPLENEVLEIPPPAAADPNKTQVVTEEELRAEMAKIEQDKVIDMPPAEPSPLAAEPSVSSTPPSPFGDTPSSTPPSPFAAQDDPMTESGPPNFPTTPPIPSPFNAEPKESQTPTVAPFVPPAIEKEPSVKPFEQPAPAAPMAQAEFNPPAQSNMQNPQNFGQSAPPAAGGQSQTLAIISLVVGILSLCCGYTFIVPIVAIVLGFMARGKANSDPANYGGSGLALGGIITGAVALLLGVVVIILNLVMGFGGAMLQGF